MSMDRRSFLRGAGAAVAAGTVAGTALAEEAAPSWSNVSIDASQFEAEEREIPSWVGEAPAITPEDCVETIETDVLVVGSALAGCLAAYSAVNNGAKVVMIERNCSPHISGSGIGFFNSEYQKAGGQREHNCLAAYSAVNNGAKVVMIERNCSPHISGSGIGFFNSEYQKAGGQREHNVQKVMNLVINEGNLRVDPALVAPHISGSGIGFFNSEYQKAGGQREHNVQKVMNLVINEGNLRVDPALVAQWAYHSGDILDEIEANVLQPAGLPGTISIGEPLDEEEIDQYIHDFHVDFDDTGHDSLEKFDYIFHDWIRDHGGEIVFHTTARKLVQDETGAVLGAICTNPDGDYVYYKTNKGVIMCAGSYAGNHEMVDALCYPSLARFIKRYSGYNAKMTDTAPVDIDEKMDDGIGHRMMMWAGAIFEEIDPSYQAWSNDGYWIAAPLAVNNKGSASLTRPSRASPRASTSLSCPTA